MTIVARQPVSMVAVGRRVHAGLHAVLPVLHGPLQARKRKEERQREEESSGGWLGWASSWVTGGDSLSAGDEEPVAVTGE